MATAPNITQITAPRVELIDPRSGLMSREWYRFFYNLYTITGEGTGVTLAINGGTGISSYSVGSILYANTTTTLAKLPDVATGNALISGGVNAPPLWGKIGLSTHVSGLLTVPNGGTGATTLTGYVRGNGAAALTATATIPNTDITGLGTISVKNIGASGSFTTVDLKTVTVVDGIITSIV
jgi:hypothetical protein